MITSPHEINRKTITRLLKQQGLSSAIPIFPFCSLAELRRRELRSLNGVTLLYFTVL